jgi:predicted HAD superfamily Cof-like phosphohydrolase
MNTLKNVEEFMAAAGQTIYEAVPHDASKVPGFRETVVLRIRLLFEELKELATACGLEGVDTFAKLCNTFLKDEANLIIRELKISNLSDKDWDPLETLDALIDLRYVLDGAVLSLGFKNIFEEAFDEVHNNNMTKFMTTEEQISETKAAYELKNVPVTIEENLVGYHACKDEYGKLRKPVGYRSVNLYPILKKVLT